MRRTPRGIIRARSLVQIPWGTIKTFVFFFEEACVSSSLYSDNQNDVDALARRIAALTSLSSKQAAVISRGLLGRKVLKIKSSSLGGLFRSIDKDIDTKRLRDEFIKSGLIERIDETGVDGRPAIYSICAKVSELIIVDGAEDLNDGFDAEEETAPAETLAVEAKDAGQAAPAAAACGSEKDSGSAKPAAPRAEDTRRNQELPAVAPSEAAQKEEQARPNDTPAPFVSKVGRGARVHCRAQDKRQHKTSGAILPSNRSLLSNKNPLSQRAKSRRFMPRDPGGGSFRLRMLRPLPSRRKRSLPQRQLSQRKVPHPSGRRQIKAAPLPPCEALNKSSWTLRAKRTVLRPKRTALRTGGERGGPGVPRRSSRLTSRIRLRLRQWGLIARTILLSPNLALSYA